MIISKLRKNRPFKVAVAVVFIAVLFLHMNVNAKPVLHHQNMDHYQDVDHHQDSQPEAPMSNSCDNGSCCNIISSGFAVSTPSDRVSTIYVISASLKFDKRLALPYHPPKL